MWYGEKAVVRPKTWGRVLGLEPHQLSPFVVPISASPYPSLLSLRPLGAVVYILLGAVHLHSLHTFRTLSIRRHCDKAITIKATPQNHSCFTFVHCVGSSHCSLASQTFDSHHEVLASF